MAGAGQKFAVGPGPQGEHVEAKGGHLPEAYGTGKVLLLAREPHWLYSHWDLTREQQRGYNARSVHHHLVLRVHAEADSGQPEVEQHVHADSRSWFIHVNGAATRYVAELGFYQGEEEWVSIGSSSAVTTPADAASEDRNVRYAAMVAQMQGVAGGPAAAERRVRPRRVLVQGELFRGGAEAGQVADEPSGGAQGTARPTGPEWALAQERAIAEEIGLHEVEREQAGSIEIAELVRGQLEQEIPSGAELGSISSAWGGQQGGKEFWLSVNADLIIYGGTEPNARVTLGGRPVTVRLDGTFSCRVELPDGEYEVLVEAVSVENEARQARLKFRRCTEGKTADSADSAGGIPPSAGGEG